MLVLYAVVLGKLAGEVGSSTLPEDDKLAVGNLILELLKSRDVCFGAALFDGFVGDASVGGVFSVDGHGRLCMYHINKVCVKAPTWCCVTGR